MRTLNLPPRAQVGDVLKEQDGYRMVVSSVTNILSMGQRQYLLTMKSPAKEDLYTTVQADSDEGHLLNNLDLVFEALKQRCVLREEIREYRETEAISEVSD